MDISTLNTAIVTFGESTPTDVLLEYGDKIDAAKALIREVEAEWKAKMLERIQASGPIVSGTVKYYAGVKKTTRCVDVAAALETLLVTVGGDFGKVCEHLSANALKYGAMRNTLSPDAYALLFVTEEEPELKEGVAKKELMKLDSRFVK